MNYNWIEIDGKTAYITYTNKKNGKNKYKTYNIYDEWVYHNGPICNIKKVVAEDELKTFYYSAIKQFEKEVKEFLQKRAKRNWEIISIEFSTKQNVKPCRELSIKQCLDIMTPRQFLDEFGAFPQIVKEG